MKSIKRLLLILSLATLLLTGLCLGVSLFYTADGQGVETAADGQEPEAATPASEAEDSLPEDKEASANAEPEPFQEYDITLMALGDNLMHMGIVYTGKQTDGSWDFSFLFEGIQDFLETADIKIINQETILAGNEKGFSGYPYFNSPTEVGDAIAAAGFNVVLHASNHAADQGVKGLINCAEFWEQYPDVLMTGIYTEEKKDSDIPLLTIKDITFAVLNYTYGPNMEILPEELEGHLELLCNCDPDTNRMDFTTLHPQVLEDIRKAEALADIVIVCPHWGTEYTTEPSSYQEDFALQMTEAGADLILGTHPHVIQPVTWITSENGNRALCYYSLGNYVSTQKTALCMLEAMAWVTFHVDEEGVSLSETNTGALPLICHYTSGPVRLENVYLLENYTKEDAARHGIRSYGGVTLSLEDLEQWSQEILGEWVLRKEQLQIP